MLDTLPDATIAALLGAAGGIMLGLAARLGRFCTLGAIEDFLYQNNTVRLRMWGLAVGIAGLTVFGAALFGVFNPDFSIYYRAPFSPLAHIAGGLMFGYGMALAGNCGFGALARSGGGDLRSFVIVLIMGISAYAMLSGPLARLRVSIANSTAVDLSASSYPELLGSVSGLDPEPIGAALGLLIIALALYRGGFGQNRAAMGWAAVVGMAIALGWIGTYQLSQIGFGTTAVISHTFTAPIGETLLFLMTSTAGGLSFGVGSVLGVLVGAIAGSLIKGHFRWEACEDPRELKRQFLGATLMGFGAVLALGCTVGQGISAFAVFSLGAPLTFGAIFVGAALGLRQLITGFRGVVR
ncbi:MAG: YeeE/YedE family protein [Roseovarius sp.]